MTDKTAWENDDTPLPRTAAKTEHQFHGAAPGRKSHTVYPKQVIVLVGTLGGGIEFYGPFADGFIAMEWAGEHFQVGVDVRLETLNIVRSN